MSSMLAALGLGLMGAGHCMSMCAGIVAALSFAGDPDARRQYWLHLAYSCGRIGTYGLLGGLVAAFSSLIPVPGFPVARTLAGLLLIALGMHFLGKGAGMLWLERTGHGVWRKLKPLATALVPVKHPWQALAAGAVWGWLPCGLVYSALAYSATQNAFLPGAAVMLSFGVGTLPALLIGGFAAARLQSWFRRKQVRTAAALGYIIFGAWTMGSAWYHYSMHSHPAATSTDAPHHHAH